MKINFKNKAFIVSLFTTVLIGLGASFPEQTGAVLGGLTCGVVTCNA